MMRDFQRWVEPDGPTGCRGSLAKIHVFVIEKKGFVEAAELLETISSHEQAAPGDPIYQLASRLRPMGTFPPRSWKKQPGQRST